MSLKNNILPRNIIIVPSMSGTCTHDLTLYDPERGLLNPPPSKFLLSTNLILGLRYVISVKICVHLS